MNDNFVPIVPPLLISIDHRRAAAAVAVTAAAATVSASMNFKYECFIYIGSSKRNA